jgi:hypothetical protein
MFKIPLTESDVSDMTRAEKISYILARLKVLAEVAKKMTDVGWPVTLTSSGLAFDPIDIDFEEEIGRAPDPRQLGEEFANALDDYCEARYFAVDRRLDELGIGDDVEDVFWPSFDNIE